MYEKVNPAHPDKLADRIAGALVDYAYTIEDAPAVALEVLLGHGRCWITGEASVVFPAEVLMHTVERIAGISDVEANIVKQDAHLSDNRLSGARCGDNGIFRGCPITEEQRRLADVAGRLYRITDSDGKYLSADGNIVICQSGMERSAIEDAIEHRGGFIVNPLGSWSGGSDVDAGATNRKLGSDMGDAITGGGLHGKDLSKADVTVNICAHLRAQETGSVVEAWCAIGDDHVSGIPYAEMMSEAQEYIRSIGGFEALAEWGLIRPEVDA